jgi:hypothetical protein
VNASDRIRSTAEEDERIESAVLSQVLDLHPTAITLDELVREMGGDAFAEGDAIERAVRDLAAAGLVHRHDALLLPTRAALRFWELTED